jgi:hypothetical protein
VGCGFVVDLLDDASDLLDLVDGIGFFDRHFWDSENGPLAYALEKWTARDA